jgi:pimeloyl-ACP methyl ester carboxylesterase
MSDRRGGRVPARALSLSAAAVGAAVGLALERRHLRRIERDEDYAHLNAPLRGRPLSVNSADGTALNVEVFGPEAGHTVVLAHGWTERLSFWGRVIELLVERGLRPVAYDLRGHGRSAPATEHDYGLERFGEDLEAVLATVLEDGERATVVGHSLGAMSIAAWAEHHDVLARARAAALINTGLGDLVAGHLLLGELAKWLPGPLASRMFLGSRAPMPGFSTPLQHALIRYVAFGPTATTGQVAFFERMLIDCPPDVRAATGVALSKMDLWDAVSRLTVPTLVVTGTQDRLTPPAHARRIAASVPNLHALLELPETGHMSPLERPAELTEALAKLIAETTPKPEGRLPSPASPGL